MSDVLQQLKAELAALQSDLAGRAVGTMLIGEYRELREREQSLKRRIDQLSSPGRDDKR